MAYQCTKSNTECDGCGICRRTARAELYCALCGEALCEGECYYNIDGMAICGECIDSSRRTA